MNSEQIQLIKESWEILSQDSQIVVRFYDRLFETTPETRRYFPQDMSKQSEKLAYTLGFVVANLDRFDKITESVEDLGRLHQRLHIKPEYYLAVKDALIWTIARALDAGDSSKTIQAWDLALSTIADIMINAPEKRKPRFFSLVGKLFKSE